MDDRQLSSLFIARIKFQHVDLSVDPKPRSCTALAQRSLLLVLETVYLTPSWSQLLAIQHTYSRCKTLICSTPFKINSPMRHVSRRPYVSLSSLSSSSCTLDYFSDVDNSQRYMDLIVLSVGN